VTQSSSGADEKLGSRFPALPPHFLNIADARNSFFDFIQALICAVPGAPAGFYSGPLALSSQAAWGDPRLSGCRLAHTLPGSLYGLWKPTCPQLFTPAEACAILHCWQPA